MPNEMEALKELQVALQVYTVCNDPKNLEKVRHIVLQLMNTHTYGMIYSCECGTILCREAPEAISATLMVLERTDSINTEAYALIQRAVLCAQQLELI